MLGQVVADIRTMQLAGLSHGDMRPRNVLVDREVSIVKVKGFGFSGSKWCFF